MVSIQARTLATMLLGNYPGSGIQEMNVLALAETFERMGMDIAPQVADRAKTELDRPPSSAQLYAIAREVRIEVGANDWRAERPTLAAIEGVEMPEELRAKVHAMVNPLRVLKKQEAESKLESIEWERRKAAVMARQRVPGACDGSGKVPVESGGKRVCPDCGTEIVEIVAEPIDGRRRPRLV
jgi:hypothetical protein